MQEVLKQIKRILRSHSLDFEERDSELGLRFDSAIVWISVAMAGGQRLIHLRSKLLSEISKEVRVSEILSEMNRLNTDHMFGKWVYYPEHRAVSLEYDFLGDHLQQAELLTALAAVARQADSEDDALQLQFGGRRAVEGSRVVSEPEPALDKSDKPGSCEYSKRIRDPEWVFLALLAMHMTKAEISSRTGLTKNQINSELRRLYEKYGAVSKRGELVVEAKARGVL